MAPIGALWTDPVHPSSKVINATAAFAGLELEIPAYEHFVDNKTPGFLNKFPHGQIPAFESAEGFKLFEGLAIARYIATRAPESGLLGASPQEAALIDQWIHLVDSEIYIPTKYIRVFCKGICPGYTKPIHAFLHDRETRALHTLDQHLSTHTFFVGERITLADIFIAGTVHKIADSTFDAAARAANPHLVRHLQTVVNQPQLKEVFGETPYVERPIQFTPPAKKEKAPAPPSAPKVAKNPKEGEEAEDSGALCEAGPCA